MKPTSEELRPDKDEPPSEPTRLEIRQIIEEYAASLREIIEKLRVTSIETASAEPHALRSTGACAA